MSKIIFSEPYDYTEAQRQDQINGSMTGKALFLYCINPVEFIKATTLPEYKHKKDQQPQWEYLIEKTKTFDYYNKKLRATKMEWPFLYIDFPSMQITDHDGRSRCLVAHTMGHKFVPIHIKSGWRLESKDQLDFPMTVKYQHGNGFLTIHKRNVVEFFEKDSWFNQ